MSSAKTFELAKKYAIDRTILELENLLLAADEPNDLANIIKKRIVKLAQEKDDEEEIEFQVITQAN